MSAHGRTVDEPDREAFVFPADQGRPHEHDLSPADLCTGCQLVAVDRDYLRDSGLR